MGIGVQTIIHPAKAHYILLVLPDFPQGNSSGSELVGLLDSRMYGSGLPSNLLGGQLLPGNLLRSRFPCSLFGSRHL